MDINVESEMMAQRIFAQKVINAWKNELFMDGELDLELVDGDEDDCTCYGGGVITLTWPAWIEKSILEKLSLLGHEFTHWIQEKEIEDFGGSYIAYSKPFEDEAWGLGRSLARKQLERWAHPEKYPRQLQLALTETQLPLQE